MTRYKQVRPNPVWVRINPNMEATAIDILKPNTVIEVDKLSANKQWAHYSKGWVQIQCDDRVMLKQLSLEESKKYDIDKFSRSINTIGIPSEKEYDALFHTNLMSFSHSGYAAEASGDSKSGSDDSSNGDSKDSKKNESMVDKAKDKVKNFMDTVTTDIKSVFSPSTVKDAVSNWINDAEAHDKAIENLNMNMQSINSIFGIPYQWMDIVDAKSPNNNQYAAFGRKYAERVIARMPLLIMTPGDPQFLGKFDEKDRENFVKANFSHDFQGPIQDILNRPGQYYSFKKNNAEYTNSVKNILQTTSAFLGITGTQVGGKNIVEYCLEKNDTISSFYNYFGSIAFYINSDKQVSDNFGNSTTQSQLADKINSYSAMAKELQFLLGGASNLTGLKLDQMNANDLAKNDDNAKDATKKALNGPGILSLLKDDAKVIMSGGKIMFPEIWDDSTYSKECSIELKLATPDADPVSWYINIMAPIAHLLPFVQPRQSTVNGYVAPFLVRAFYKGLYNIDLGIVTGMTINRGDEGGWNQVGLPTTVDVSMTIKDLYSMMMQTVAPMGTTMMSNVSLLDYLANFCGLNINAMSYERLVAMAIIFIENAPRDYLNSQWNKLLDWVHNSMDAKLVERFLRY